jgi:peroxiredoxin Q/BCP
MKKFVLSSFLAFSSWMGIAQVKHPGVGDLMPAFKLTDQDGKIFDSKDYVGKKILVIYFYPKDETSVCTKEACTFRDSFQNFVDAGAMVVGINFGTVESHKSFQQNHKLPFTILSDPGNQVMNLFGVKGKLIFTGRETFVIDLSGKIVFTFDSMTDGAAHAQKALEMVKKLNSSTNL